MKNEEENNSGINIATIVLIHATPKRFLSRWRTIFVVAISPLLVIPKIS